MSEARIEQRWTESGDMSWCIIHGDKIISFGEPGGKEICERWVGEPEGFNHCAWFMLTEPPAPPAPQGSGEHKLVAENAGLRKQLAEALTLGAEQVLEIQELLQVVKEYREMAYCGTLPSNAATRCSTCIKADALLEPKAKPTQQGDKE